MHIEKEKPLKKVDVEMSRIRQPKKQEQTIVPVTL